MSASSLGRGLGKRFATQIERERGHPEGEIAVYREVLEAHPDGSYTRLTLGATAWLSGP